jgi:hypothetical protein
LKEVINMSQGNREPPEELLRLLQQLVQNGQFRMAGRVLHTYFRRCWKENEQVATYYIVKWFEKNFPIQLEKHKKMKVGKTQ